MNKIFIALTVAGLATTQACISLHAAGDLAIDGTGNLFAASSASRSIFKFTPDGKKSTFASRVSPDKMVVDGAGNLFVAEEHFQEDRHVDVIFKFTPDGKKSTFASGLEELSHMVLDGAGNLFVRERHFEKDHDVEVIFKFTPDGKKSTFASGSDYGDVAFDAAGNLFVVNSVRHADSSILKFTPDRKQSTFASGVSTADYGVYILGVDDNSNLFVTIYVPDPAVNYYSILKFTPDGTKSTFASGLADPVDAIFDNKGHLFVGDKVSDSILKFTPDGKKSTFATGVGVNGMALDAAGNLFVLEGGSELLFKFTPDGSRSTFVSDRVSPDKQWEYQCSADRENPRIVKAGTSQTVLDLSEKVPEWGNEAKIVWSPDSKRFAVNYTEGSQSHVHASSAALYQLRGDKWVALRSPVTDETTKPVERAQFAQLNKMHLPIPGHKLWYTKKVLKWIDGNTALLYSSLGVMGDDFWPETGFLFTLNFDAKGNWKIVKRHQMSEKEAENEDAPKDVSGPAQATDQKEPGADASFGDADRHLNEVYNMLRARLSPSERDSLKKEQLAWLNRRTAAVQVAKENAEENSADREATKMTLARVAELEKRLKKAK